MKGGVKVITEEKEADVTFLSDAELNFVSLVRHGANRSPFRVIKKEKGGAKQMVVQSILIPKDVSLEELSKVEGCEWVVEAKEDKKEEFDTYDKYIQIDEKKFDRSTLQLKKLDSKGTFAMVGSLVDNGTKGDVLTVPNQKADIPIAPMDAPVAEMEGPAFVLTFRDMFDRELSSFLDVVRGSMSQSNVDPKKRKSAVMNALGAFGNFLSVGIDLIGTSSSKKTDKVENVIGEAASRIMKAVEDSKKLDGGAEMSELFKTKEEFTSAVAEIVNQVLDAKKAEEDKVVTDPVLDTTLQAKPTGDGEIVEDASKVQAGGVVTKLESEDKALVQKVDKLSSDFAAFKTSFEEFGNSLSAPPAALQETVEDNPRKSTAEKPSVFAGLFVKKSQEAVA